MFIWKIFKKLNGKVQEATKALGGTYVPNPQWNKLTNYDMVTVHPLGGCVMGDDAAASVTNHIGQVYNRVLRQLGIHGASGTHFLRRTFATVANELTGDFYAVSKILDHSSTDVTQRYVRPMASQARRVAEAVNGALMLQAKTPSAYVRT